MRYVLMETSLFNAQNRAHLKGFNYRSGFYVQDSEETLAKYEFSGDNKEYYVISWQGQQPSSLLPRYREDGNNQKSNKIMTEEEILSYIRENAIFEDDLN